MNYERYERPYRSRRPERQEPNTDVLSRAITAQVIICVMLVICAVAMKKMNVPEYAEMKSMYSVMISDSAETDRAIAWFSDQEGVFGRIFNAAGAFFDKLFHARATPQTVIEPGDTREDEPEDPPTGEGPAVNTENKSANEYPGETEAPSLTAESPLPRAYDYLGRQEAVYLSASPSSGGLLPVNVKDSGGMMSPPEGSTLSPVYLGTKIKPPLTGMITSQFAFRKHPVTGENDFHTGMDIASVEGRAILAAMPGKVTEVGESEIYGNYIVIEHSSKLKTSYSHCSEIIAKEGMLVRQGERIALVGQTGVATGPHLHFSVIVEDQFTDPAWVLSNFIRTAR